MSFCTHGMSRTGLYRVWGDMKQRCLNPKHKDYPNYGSKGITVCKRWMKFINFYEDMGERPKNKSLDRINNDGNYEPGNCRWATSSEQQQNKNNIKGCCFYKGKWRSYIQKNKKRYFLGIFNTEKEAHQRYLDAKLKYHRKRKRKEALSHVKS